MPSISKIRFANIIYENGQKRYLDDVFRFDGHNGAILLENGGGKTVFIQTALQAVLPHTDLADRQIKHTLSLTNATAHIAIEWILQDAPFRLYGVTAVSLFMKNDTLHSHKFTYRYKEGDAHSIERLPFTMLDARGKNRPATSAEIYDYYATRDQESHNANLFDTIGSFKAHLEENFKIIPSEWESLAKINGGEGDVEAFFDACKTTNDLVNRLLIPTVQMGMSGKGTADFVQLFEKKRDHFKKYKQLMDQIRENKRVEQELNRIMGHFAAQDIAEQSELAIKIRAKSFFHAVDEEYKATETHLQEIARQRSEILFLQEQNKEQFRLLSLTGKYHNLQAANQEYQFAFQQYQQKNDLLQGWRIEFDTLRYLRDKQALEQKQAQLESEQKRLDSLDQEEDADLIAEHLQKTEQQLRGIHLDQEKQLTQQIAVATSQIEHATAIVTGLDKQIDQVKQSRLDLQLKEQSHVTRLQIITANMDELAHKALVHPHEQSLADEYPKWKSQLVQSQASFTQIEQQMYRVKQNKGETLNQIEQIQNLENSLKEDLHRLGHFLSLRAEKEQELLKQLRVIPGLRTLDNIDASLHKVEHVLELQISQKKQQLAEARQKERIATRLYDLYSDCDSFIADPHLLDFIERCDRPIESGSSYAQRLLRERDLSTDELFHLFPFWHMSLIVQPNDREWVRERLHNQQKDDGMYPLVVLTTDEALALEHGNFPYLTLLPSYWTEALSSLSYLEWKTGLSEQAKQAEDLYEEKLHDFSSSLRIQEELHHFLEQYPEKEYREYEQSHRQKIAELQELEQKLAACRKQYEHFEEELERALAAKDLHQAQIDHLERIIVLAQDWQRKDKEKQQTETDLAICRNELEELAYTEKQLFFKKAIERRGLEEMESTRDSFQEQLHRLHGRELYRKLLGYAPLPATMSEARLEEERIRYQELLYRVNHQRNAVLKQMERIEQDIASIHLRLEAEIGSIDRKLHSAFPQNGEARISKLAPQIKTAEQELQQWQNDVLQQAKEKQIKSEFAYDEEKASYENDYNKNPVLFVEPLDSVKTRLNVMQARINDSLDVVNKQEQQYLQLQNELSSLLRLMELRHAQIPFLSDSVPSIGLSEEDQTSYPYQRSVLVDNTLKELEQAHQRVGVALEQVRGARASFERFCMSEEIRDERMRQTALNGIRQRTTFATLQEWELLMKERIGKANAMADRELREHNEDIKHFIDQLHQHLTTICQEMASIVRMTRVKVDHGAKDIYAITVPTWDETEAKQRLYNRLEDLTVRLGSDDYKTDDGIEDSIKIRRDIERWLHPKQLFAAISREPFRVQVRKVSNDNRISNALAEWSTSNNWSGGEKWSKNMALFLGIQSYLAEKRQPIAKSKTNTRVVILDNPFGKASSDHVLEPVFFIAERLGYQIIALTAHAEGKFLRDYFPIIYSCRLRESVNGDTSILTREKIIRHAYFKDLDPLALERLGEVKQIEAVL